MMMLVQSEHEICLCGAGAQTSNSSRTVPISSSRLRIRAKIDRIRILPSREGERKHRGTGSGAEIAPFYFLSQNSIITFLKNLKNIIQIFFSVQWLNISEQYWFWIQIFRIETGSKLSKPQIRIRSSTFLLCSTHWD